MPRTLPAAAIALELLLLLAGLALLARWLATGEARQHRVKSLLPAWPIAGQEFALFLALAIGGWFLLGGIGVGAAKALELDKNLQTLVAGGFGQVGLLAGVVLYRLGVRPPATREPRRLRGVVLSGIAAFLMSLPVVTVVSLGWRYLLTRIGYPVQPQELIGLFKNPGSGEILAVITLLAVVAAPISEELVFRGGIFRFLRTRVRPGLALVASSLVFAVIHVNLPSIAPLFVLAVVFSLAYERTGSLATPIVAHALFNLNTVVLVVSGAHDLV